MKADTHSHRLTPADGSSKAPWLLEWDEERLTLRDADGAPVLETATAQAHHVIDLSEAFIDGKVGLVSPRGTLWFKQNRAALAGLRELVDAGLRSDPEYRAAMRRRALWAMPGGAAMFLIAGGLFGAYCWYVSRAPEPPPDSWVRSVGWLIKGTLAVLMAIALLGLGLGCYGLRQWWRIRSIERGSGH